MDAADATVIARRIRGPRCATRVELTRFIGVWAVGLSGLAACGDDSAGLELPYATTVVRFEAGAGAGFGQLDLPDVVLGPPSGLGRTVGSLDVLSLGVGGHIILGFDEPIVDGPGHDFVVFENPFYVDDDPEQVFAELGAVSVSPDGEEWYAFSCAPSNGSFEWPGCAGWRPTLVYDPSDLQPLEPDRTGGDPFDLADLGLDEVRFVRVDDLSTDGEAPSAGFDLDAVGYVRRLPL